MRPRQYIHAPAAMCMLGRNLPAVPAIQGMYLEWCLHVSDRSRLGNPPPAHWTSRASGGQTGRRKCSRIEDRERRKPPSPGLRHPQTRFIRGLTNLSRWSNSLSCTVRRQLVREVGSAEGIRTQLSRRLHPDAAVTAPLVRTQLTRQGIHP